MNTATATFDITIGPFNRSYRLYQTQAPVDYDGFGTITVTQAGDERFVLVNVEHEAWQLGRYSSGMKTATPVELEGSVEQAIVDHLLPRLSQQEAR